MNNSRVLGIDIGGTGLKVGLVATEAEPKLLAVDVLHGHHDQDPVIAIDRMTAAALALLASQGVELEDVAAVGIGCAGLVDAALGVLRTSPNLPSWRNVPIRTLVEERLGRPVHLANDAEAFLHAEWTHGAARGARTAIFLTIGTGVGGGLVIEGRPFRGTTGLGSEIGHMSVSLDGPECPCGNRGCLELFVGRAAIEREGRARGFPLEETSPARLAEKADGGDARAIAIFEEVGRRLGIAIAGLANLLEPEVVVVGGGIAASSHLILPAAEGELTKRSFVARERRVLLEAARFGPAAGLIGAALRAIGS